MEGGHVVEREPLPPLAELLGKGRVVVLQDLHHLEVSDLRICAIPGRGILPGGVHELLHAVPHGIGSFAQAGFRSFAGNALPRSQAGVVHGRGVVGVIVCVGLLARSSEARCDGVMACLTGQLARGLASSVGGLTVGSCPQKQLHHRHVPALRSKVKRRARREVTGHIHTCFAFQKNLHYVDVTLGGCNVQSSLSGLVEGVQVHSAIKENGNAVCIAALSS
mmetsp:Transcript_10451/g.16709  ORF Transcript_10451/g.16709 Transcript_10451/m.16709 type:complete len:221 (-) Transcript_10451:456-1118(-)